MRFVLICLGVFLAFAVASTTAGPNTDLPQRTRSTSLLYVDVPHAGDTASNGDTIYTDTSGLSFTGGDYTPSEPCHGILLTSGTGVVSVVLLGGGQISIPISVSDSSALELFRGYAIREIDSAKTTFSGNLYPLF